MRSSDLSKRDQQGFKSLLAGYLSCLMRTRICMERKRGGDSWPEACSWIQIYRYFANRARPLWLKYNGKVPFGLEQRRYILLTASACRTVGHARQSALLLQTWTGWARKEANENLLFLIKARSIYLVLAVASHATANSIFSITTSLYVRRTQHWMWTTGLILCNLLFVFRVLATRHIQSFFFENIHELEQVYQSAQQRWRAARPR